jgi:predicted AAA+ superfamily ATPase
LRRNAEVHLKEWFSNDGRKPLVLRGARQVGKTWLVRNFSNQQSLTLIEINFERNLKAKSLFASNDPFEYISLLEQENGERIDLKNSLLFLDEIQAYPEMLSKLRWLYEEIPELPVIAAGSLLDFTLADHTFSMPVGRISYYYLEPFSFFEFLNATKHEILVETLNNISLDQIKKESPIHPSIHEKINNLFKVYSIVGGMPEPLKIWNKTGSYLNVSEVQHNLLETYRDDFSKYSKRSNKNVLDVIFTSVPQQIGSVIKYSRLSKDHRSEVIKNAFELLCTARICHKVISTSAEGVPLGATVNLKKFKAIFLDIGLVSASLGMRMDVTMKDEDLILVNNGAIAEQAVGQLLRTNNPHYIEPKLHYWARDKKGSEAEVDYIIAENHLIVPIEVKAGKTGSMKSLHTFMVNKNLNLAIRVNSDQPSWMNIDHHLVDGRQADYKLLSIPSYMVELIPKFIQSELQNHQGSK